jgi:dihydroorotate dehydrogenase (fumarate)/dihydroorotate dehydrogenase
MLPVQIAASAEPDSLQQASLPFSVSGLLYKHIARPICFRVDAETLHDLAIASAERASRSGLLLSAASRFQPRPDPRLHVEIGGVSFAHPIGLSAGYDKSGRGVPFWGALGFSHVEIGSVSADPSGGNPKPRLFRIPEDRGIVVNYGVPNHGAERVSRRLEGIKRRAPLGISITSTNRGHGVPMAPDEVIADYVRSARRLLPICDYMNINLSCPCTCEGQSFFSKAGNLDRLMEALGELKPGKPVFLKVAPFRGPRQMEEFLATASRASFVTGFEINLPPGNPYKRELRTAQEVLDSMPGAVSGKPCESLMNRTMLALYRTMDRSRYRLISAGGVFTAEDAYRKIRCGASLVQILTSFVYEGPGVIASICSGLGRLLERDGFKTIADAMGVDA